MVLPAKIVPARSSRWLSESGVSIIVLRMVDAPSGRSTDLGSRRRGGAGGFSWRSTRGAAPAREYTLKKEVSACRLRALSIVVPMAASRIRGRHTAHTRQETCHGDPENHSISL